MVPAPTAWPVLRCRSVQHLLHPARSTERAAMHRRRRRRRSSSSCSSVTSNCGCLAASFPPCSSGQSAPRCASTAACACQTAAQGTGAGGLVRSDHGSTGKLQNTSSTGPTTPSHQAPPIAQTCKCTEHKQPHLLALLLMLHQPHQLLPLLLAPLSARRRGAALLIAPRRRLGRRLLLLLLLLGLLGGLAVLCREVRVQASGLG